jgi:hypothetical protein
MSENIPLDDLTTQRTGNTTDTVNDIVDELLSDGVVTTSIYIPSAPLQSELHWRVFIQLLAASSLPLISISGW